MISERRIGLKATLGVFSLRVVQVNETSDGERIGAGKHTGAVINDKEPLQRLRKCQAGSANNKIKHLLDPTRLVW